MKSMLPESLNKVNNGMCITYMFPQEVDKYYATKEKIINK